MKIRYFILFLLVYSVLTAQSFDEAMRELSELPPGQQEEYFEDYREKQSSFPIRNKDEVIFITESKDGPPYILADFNGFLNPRYTEDKSIGLMRPVGNTSWYYFAKELKPDAVINYKFSANSGEWIDSLSPHKRLDFGDTVSFIRMGSVSETVEPTPEEKRGELFTLEIKSEIQNHTRTVHIYTPSDYENLDNLPSIYFHDGTFFTNDMKVPEMLDYLIFNNLIYPVLAVFDNPVIRGKEYSGDTAYATYINNELEPFITSNYKVSTSKDKRAVIGFSRGGMSAFYLAHMTNLFSKVGALSPAIYPTKVADFMSQLRQFSGQPNHTFVTGTFYDHFWYNDARTLQKEMEQRGIKSEYIENQEGHNIPSWQTQLDDMLIAFFGKD